ncbi:DUF4064 domain-containing protein [Haloplasma contractile]|uniref:Uncharacterized protein n=1 Tax=Haloplasma contractile SSD-17B TaxID=1033810 RepID=U2FJT5_9MOLU|nr:DUF4064 domain-containing protein [Haloplasma contractile]ERJ11504.1 hypothetical protein HLPCO_002416 [Haloplasma contractile SSD-17B]
MNSIKGKGLALGGSITSVVFTVFGLLTGLILKSVLMEPEIFKEAFAEGMADDPNISGGEAYQIASDMLPIFKTMSDLFINVGIIFLVLGIVGIVLSRIVKFNNKKGIGIFFIIVSVFHIIFGRFLVFILLLIAGIQILSSKEEEVVARESEVFDETEVY